MTTIPVYRLCKSLYPKGAMALKVLKVNHDGLTGHITCLVRVEEELTPGNITFGPEETVGIWPRALMSAFHGSEEATDKSIQAALEDWLAAHHETAVERKRHMDLCACAVGKLHGKRLEFK